MPKHTNFTTEAELRRLVDEGLSFLDIGERIGIRADYLRTTAMVLGIRNPKRAKCGDVDLHCRVDSLKAGKTVQEVADERGIKRSTLYGRLERAGLPTSFRAAALAAQRA